jgi:23S rRNA (guanosine2251-2'-O)-methyltransferase
MPELQRLSPEAAKTAPRLPLRLMLENVRSAHNVGSAFRTADGLGIEGLDLIGFTPCPPSKEIRKASLGAEHSVPWKHWASVQDALYFYKESGYQIWALEQVHDSIPLQSTPISWPQKTILIAGHELDGVSEMALEYCHGAIEIPQQGSKHSLNIATAVAMAMWEWTRAFWKVQQGCP